MSLVVRDVMIDRTDSSGLARFWGAVLHRSGAGERRGFLGQPAGRQSAVGAVFRHVADAKQVKNRLHLALSLVDGALATEVERLTAIGATILARHARGFGLGWVVLADPDGNEFCVQSGDAEADAVREHLGAEEQGR